MSETVTPKTEAPGQSFMLGLGPTGAVLYDIQSGPCLRIDDKRWSLNTSRGNLVLSQNVVDRLIAKEFVTIGPEKLMSRDWLTLTKIGFDELTRYALLRSFEIAVALDPVTLISTNGGDTGQSSQAIAYNLAEKAFGLVADDCIRRGEDYVKTRSPGRLTVEVSEGVYQEISDFLNTEKKPGDRAARLFYLINQLADSSMYGLTIGDMGETARWAGIMAAEAFERAPDQDWEIGGGEDGEGEA